MSDQLLTLLKFCLLALIYLFFFRVLRAVWAEITPPKAPAADPRAAVPAAAPVAAAAPPRNGKAAKAPKQKGRRRPATQLVVIEPADWRGRAYPVGPQLTVGRSASCQITMDDTFVSQVHARLSEQDGGMLVEDLGSTNGTFVNGSRVTGAATLKVGDRVQFGNTVLELV